MKTLTELPVQPKMMTPHSNEVDFFSVISWGKRLIFKYRKVVLLWFVVCIALGILYYIFAPRVYKARMIAASTILKGSSFIVVLDDLQRHLGEGNYTEVARLLNIDSLSASQIKKIQVFSSKNFAEKEFSDKLTRAETDAESANGEFIIEAYVFDNSILPKIQEGLIYYLNNNEYTKVKSTQRRGNLKKVVAKIHDELTQLDSMKSMLSNMYSGNTKVGNGSGNGSLLIGDPSSIYNNVLELYKSEIYTITEISEPDIFVIQGFVTYNKPNNPKLILTIFFVLFFSCFFSVVSIFYNETKGRFTY